ncbi:hypothetical protein [Candidatus Nitronereus thalassa]|uniref:Cbb3-type cytochrome oxidase component FixQ n=1 Tax=Candidatus Nitronereus thalassa TaxID=3020898 RepID=A0ABU3K744_9BACT|nr:hypothetical protein [Candidatus Nitronereus thalassa]MDT7042199.1 hypothetical protein [Candidatus Nitronereus thalassa]
MINLSSGLEAGIAAAGLIFMLGLAVWLMFRRETGGEDSLFLKMIDPFDDETESPTPKPLLLPSNPGKALTNLSPTMSHGIENLNQNMRLAPLEHHVK